MSAMSISENYKHTLLTLHLSPIKARCVLSLFEAYKTGSTANTGFLGRTTGPSLRTAYNCACFAICATVFEESWDCDHGGGEEEEEEGDGRFHSDEEGGAVGD